MCKGPRSEVKLVHLDGLQRTRSNGQGYCVCYIFFCGCLLAGFHCLHLPALLASRILLHTETLKAHAVNTNIILCVYSMCFQMSLALAYYDVLCRV